MTLRHYARHALLCALLLGTAVRAGAGWHSSLSTASDSGISIDLAAPVDHAPLEGYLICWVVIHNHSGSAHVWNIRGMERSGYGTGGSRISSSQSLRVEGGESAQLPVLMPLEPLPRGESYYRPLTIQVDGYGTESPSVASIPTRESTGKTPTPYIAMGSTLAVPLWEPLNKDFSDRSIDLTGSAVEPGLLGTDWRALSGFDCLWLTEAEYAGLDAARRAAIRAWIDRGGTFYLCTQGLDPSLRAGLGLPATGDEARPGFGFVKLVLWDGKALGQATAASMIDEVKPLHDASVVNDATDWGMTKALGNIPVNALFLIGFVVVFATLVGPVNLFWLANATRRHRLFWTTPLISLAASLLLILVIVLQDGFGGYGERTMLTLLLPDQKEAVVVQEQSARTGVLLSRDFTTTEDLVLSPLKVQRYTGKSYDQSGRRYGGGWFASRTVQAQRAEAIVPSRAEIQLLNAAAARAGAPPVVVSSIPAALRTVSYTDPTGRLWRGDNLRTGERLTLRADLPVVPAFPTGGSELLKQLAERVSARPGYFYAMSNDGPFIETLPSIHWKKQQAAFFGPVTIAP